VRWIPTLLALTLVTSVACGGKTKGPGGGGSMPAAVKIYEALRWVPADASYVIVGRRAADLSDVLRELAAVVGILDDKDPADYGRALQTELGYDPLDVEQLRGLGIDPERGAAFFGTGLSLTAVAYLADPAKLEAFIDQMRERGISIQSQMSDGVEVFTLHFDSDIQFSWAVVDGWVLSRAEILVEKAPALGWFEAAHNARGAMGAEPDFEAAVEAAVTHAAKVSIGGAPPVIGVIRPGKLADVVEQVHGAGHPMNACIATPLRDMSRILLAAGVGESGSAGSIVIDLASADRFATNTVPQREAWAQIESGAPLQLDLGLDIPSFARSLEGCPMDTRAMDEAGVRTAHVALHQFDDGLPSRGAFYADLSSDKMLSAAISDIPGIDTFSKRRKVGSAQVVDVSVPFFISLTYHLSTNLAVAAIGDGIVEKLLAPGNPRAGALFHLSLRPNDIPVETWDMFLEYVLEVKRPEARQRTITRVRTWQTADIDATIDGSRIVITAAGARRR
jgi:hypothetical protein